MPWNLITLIHGQLAQCSLPLPMSFPQSDLHFYHPLTCISLNHVCPFTTNYLFGSIHFSPIVKENLYHLPIPMECWYVQRSVAFLRNPTWLANANTQNRMVSKQMLDNIHLLPFLFTFKKMQTQHWLCQSITHLPACSRKHALSIGTTHWRTKVPKDVNCMACLTKQCSHQQSLLSKTNSSAVHTQTQQQSFLFNPQNSSKNMHTSAPSLVQGICIRKCFNHKPILWGAHILTGPQEKHAKLCASLITFYHICMDVQTDAMKPHQPDPWTIGSMQSAIANAISHTLTFISTTLRCISLNHISPFITTYLPSSIHFSSILKENLYHIFAPFLCWYVQRSGAILRNPTLLANANTQKRMFSKPIVDNICLLPFYFTFKKTQTQHWLCQSITHLSACSRKPALSIGRIHWWTNVPKDANRMECLEKAMFWTAFFALKGNSNAVHTQTQQQSFLFNPQNSSKNMHTSTPFLMHTISMRKCFNYKPFLTGANILTGPQEKHANLCASLITFYPICMDVQTDAMKPHQPYPWKIGSLQSAIANVVPTIWSAFLPPWHAFLWITSVHSSQITLLAAFRSAPFWRRISTTSLCPPNADVYKGVQPSWGVHHGQRTNAGQYPFIALLFHSQENANTILIVSEHNTSTWLI